MGPLTRVIQTGIGLAAELKAASKDRKASEAGLEESLTGERRVPFLSMTSIAHETVSDQTRPLHRRQEV